MAEVSSRGSTKPSSYRRRSGRPRWTTCCSRGVWIRLPREWGSPEDQERLRAHLFHGKHPIIRHLQQLFRVAAILGKRSGPPTEGDVVAAAVTQHPDRDRLEAVQDLTSVDVVRFGEHQHEFVPTKSSQEIRRPYLP